jgi:hypothetical protein
LVAGFREEKDGAYTSRCTDIIDSIVISRVPPCHLVEDLGRSEKAKMTGVIANK